MKLDGLRKVETGKVELALVGDFQVTGKSVERKGDEVKPATMWQVHIERLVPANGAAKPV